MFDLIVIAVLAVSAIIGFARGASRELAAMVALIGGVVAAIVTARWSTSAAHALIDTEWMAMAAGMFVVFLIAYIVLRLAGGMLARRIHETELGSIDRAIGLGFGLVRALIVLGVFNIVFHAATPPERTPAWVTGARLYPLTVICADALRAIAPKGKAMADQIAPALERAVGDSDDAPPEEKGDKTVKKGYDPAALKSLDDLVEKSR